MPNSLSVSLILLVPEKGSKSVHTCRKDMQGSDWDVKKSKQTCSNKQEKLHKRCIS